MDKRIAKAAFIGTLGVIFAIPLHAQSTIWRIDSGHSTARLYLESSQDPSTGRNVGVARLNGEVDHSRGDPAGPAFHFTIFPADSSTPLVPSNTAHSEQTFQNTPTYTVITFKSRSTVPIAADAFRVTGDLTMTFVERSAIYDPGKGYSGPIFGSPILHIEQREVVFEFHRVGKLSSKVSEKGSTQLIGSGVIGEKDFPDLVKAVSSTDWPAFVADEQCVTPLSIGEDFSGPACTGKVVELLPRIDIHCQISANTGESSATDGCPNSPSQMTRRTAAPSDLILDQLEIQLDIRLTRTN